MEKFDAAGWARTLRQSAHPLLVAGQGCLTIQLGAKPLLEYAAAVAGRLGCPVAATGNTVEALRRLDGSVRAKKMWLAELFRYLEGDWREPLSPERPDLVVSVGVPAEDLGGLVAGARGVDVVHLGPGELPEARLSMGRIPLSEWERNLEDLLRALG